MTKLEEIAELEKKIEIIKEELQTENKEKLQKLSNNFNFYYPLEDGEMELETDIISSMKSNEIEHLLQTSYIKVSEYLHYLENNPLSK